MRSQGLPTAGFWGRTDGRQVVCAAGVALLVLALAWPARAQRCPQPSAPERISAGVGGVTPNGPNEVPVASGDGCVVAFKSFATNLIPRDINGKVDVFVFDRGSGTMQRVPTKFAAVPPYPNDHSYPPALSFDGNLVAFGSESTNFVCGDANQSPDLFVVDRAAERTQSLSFALPDAPPQPGVCVEYMGGGGVPNLAPSISRDGRFVVFTSGSDDLVLPPQDENQTYDVLIVERTDSIRELVSQATTGSTPGRSGNGPSEGGVVSDDGCRIAFYSDASNIVAHDTNSARDVFLRDRCGGTTVRISVATSGGQANGPSQATGGLPAISADGRIVVFSSDASNLVAGDNNNATDVFARDWQTGVTLLISKSLHGGSANGPSQFPSMSGDGRFVVFQSDASDLVEGDSNGRTDVFVIDRDTGEIRRVSVSGSGEEGNGDSYTPSISADGTVIVFQSAATNLVPDTPPGSEDIYAVGNPLANEAGTPTPTPTGPTVTPTGPTPTPTGSTATPTPTGPTATPTGPTRTPTGPTTTPTPTGPTATPTPTGPTATLTPTSPTATPTSPTATPTGPTATPTGPTRIPTRPTPTGPTATPTGPTRTPTQGSPIPTDTSSGGGVGGGGGGGCGCRIDPLTGVPSDVTPLAALGLPIALLVLKNRRRRG